MLRFILYMWAICIFFFKARFLYMLSFLLPHGLYIQTRFHQISHDMELLNFQYVRYDTEPVTRYTLLHVDVNDNY